MGVEMKQLLNLTFLDLVSKLHQNDATRSEEHESAPKI